MKIDEIVKLTQNQLFAELKTRFKGKAIFCNKGYILVKGKAPIMLLAHLDTVHREPVKYICKSEDGNIIMSPQGIGGDDRCGVYALLEIYRKAQIKPWLLFTCDEEVGGVGAGVFVKHHEKGKMPKALKKIKMLIEIDRKGSEDAVYYDCANDEFEAYITSKGFKTDFGSFSDISLVAPELGVAAVNLSSGYYNAHTQHEYINMEHLNKTIQRVEEIVAEVNNNEIPQYEYVEDFYRGYGAGYGWYDGWYDKDYFESKAKAAEDSEDEDFVALQDVPKEIRREYAVLLDLYSDRELERLRKEHGDTVIPMLFESEFGMDYDSLVYAESDEDDI